jgi:hypothetical protein
VEGGGGGGRERNRESSSKVQGDYVIVIRHICKATYSMPVERLDSTAPIHESICIRDGSQIKGANQTSKPQQQQPKNQEKRRRRARPIGFLRLASSSSAGGDLKKTFFILLFLLLLLLWNEMKSKCLLHLSESRRGL